MQCESTKEKDAPLRKLIMNTTIVGGKKSGRIIDMKIPKRESAERKIAIGMTTIFVEYFTHIQRTRRICLEEFPDTTHVKHAIKTMCGRCTE